MSNNHHINHNNIRQFINYALRLDLGCLQEVQEIQRLLGQEIARHPSNEQLLMIISQYIEKLLLGTVEDTQIDAVETQPDLDIDDKPAGYSQEPDNPEDLYINWEGYGLYWDEPFSEEYYMYHNND